MKLRSERTGAAFRTRGLKRHGGLGRRLLLRLRLGLGVHQRGLEAVGEEAQRGRLRQEPCTRNTVLCKHALKGLGTFRLATLTSTGSEVAMDLHCSQGRWLGPPSAARMQCCSGQNTVSGVLHLVSGYQ